MSVYNINPGSFFKPLGLENKIIFNKTTKDSENLTTSIWTNSIKSWELYFFNKNSSHTIKVIPGTFVKIVWPTHNVKTGKLNNDSNFIYSGPAQIIIYPVNMNSLEKQETISTNSEEILPFKKEKYNSFFNSRKKKAKLNTNNNLFLAQMSDVINENQYKVFISLRGIGYRVFVSDDKKSLNFKLGYTHPINVKIPNGVSATSSTDKSATIGGGDNQFLTLESSNKQLVTQYANLLVTLRPPEPYKGKGMLIRTKALDLRRQILLKAGKRKGA